MHVWIEEECRATTFSSNARHYAMSFFANLPLSILNYLALAVKDNLSLCNIIDRAIKYKKVSSKKLLPLKPLSRVFPFKCHKPLFGVSMYELLAKSKVSFNIHACAAADTVDNMRLFQATGMGSCLLTDYGVNIRDLFIPDIEVVTYSSLDECIEKAEYLLRNEKVRSEIALRGQKRTLESHTAIQRCNQIDALIKS